MVTENGPSINSDNGDSLGSIVELQAVSYDNVLFTAKESGLDF